VNDDYLPIDESMYSSDLSGIVAMMLNKQPEDRVSIDEVLSHPTVVEQSTALGLD
jgi:hypothetical protein